MPSKRSLPAGSGLVYSTDAGTMCPGCRQPVKQCVCRVAAVPAGDGTVRVSRETKGRAGKGVTLIRGLALDADALATMARSLKSFCGSGGTVKDGTIEIQGDHRNKLIEHLRAQGHSVKQAGG